MRRRALDVGPESSLYIYIMESKGFRDEPLDCDSKQVAEAKGEGSGTGSGTDEMQLVSPMVALFADYW